jgi:hypothetical protein
MSRTGRTSWTGRTNGRGAGRLDFRLLISDFILGGGRWVLHFWVGGVRMGAVLGLVFWF